MQENNLPKDMGKRIADALKRQGASDENAFTQEENQAVYNENYTPAEETGHVEAEEAPSFDFSAFQQENATLGAGSPIFSVDSSEIDDNPELKLSIDSEDETEEFEMPNNINVLKRLIGQLPSGVPRQTGAQIIRQTIEALGIPMKSVLQDAQRVRDCLNSSIKDCSYTIQEYKSNIRNLEKQSAGYQRQLARLNDIIGLFVYNDRK